MSGVNGPALDKLKAELQTWALKEKTRLRMLLTNDYPFGAVKIDPVTQFSRFMEMTGQDYEQLVQQLNTKYLGDPQAYDKVNQELAAFLDHMVGIALREGGV